MEVWFVYFFGRFVLWFFIIINAYYIILLGFSIVNVREYFIETTHKNLFPLLKPSMLPPVAIIMPVFNEGKVIVESVKNKLLSDYPQFELIVVNDGSADNTLNEMIQAFNLEKNNDNDNYYSSREFRNLTVINKEHTDKSDSLNIAIKFCKAPIIITTDADSFFVSNTAQRLVISMLMHEGMVAEGGALFIANGCEIKNGKIKQKRLPKKIIPLLQVGEYLRAFLFGRLGWDHVGGNLCLPGALTIFDRGLMVRVDGFETKNPSQDVEIIVRLHQFLMEAAHRPFHIGYTPAASLWTFCPDNLKRLWKQRASWQHYTLHSISRHPEMFLNPRYGLIGLLTYPYFLFGEIIAPFVEILAYAVIIVGMYYKLFTMNFVILMVLVSLGVSFIITMTVVLINAVSFDEYRANIFVLFVLAFIELFGYRQFVILSRIYGTLRYIFG